MFKEPSGHTGPSKIPDRQVYKKNWTHIFDDYKDATTDRPDMQSFSSIYPPEEIERDLDFLKKLKSKEVEATLASKVLENIIIEQAELSNWLGDGSFIIPLTEYDDRVSRGDAVLEFLSEDGEVIRILLDITTSTYEPKLTEKFKKGFSRIDKMAEVKYFRSEVTDFGGKITNIPLVTIGISPETLQTLCGKFAENKNQSENIVQHILLDEIISHLIYMLAISEKINGLNSGITLKLQRTLKAVEAIADKKQSLRTKSVEAEMYSDETYSKLMNLSI